MTSKLVCDEPRRVQWTFEAPLDAETHCSDKFLYHGCRCHLQIWSNPVGRQYFLTLLSTNDGKCWPDSFYTVKAKLFGYDLPGDDSALRRLRSSSRTNLWQCEEKFINLRAEHRRRFNPNFYFQVRFYDSKGSASSSYTHNGNSVQKLEQSTQTSNYLNVAPSLQKLSGDLCRLLDDGAYCDVELKCGDLTIPAHRSILCIRSQVFEAMMRSDMSENRTGSIQIQDMEGEVLQVLIKYLYTGTLSELTVHVAHRLYEAGDKYAIDGLTRQCADYLKDNLTPENACQLLFLSDSHSDQEFKEAVITYIVEKKLPLQDDLWPDFSDSHSKLANEVLRRFCKFLSQKVYW